MNCLIILPHFLSNRKSEKFTHINCNDTAIMDENKSIEQVLESGSTDPLSSGFSASADLNGSDKKNWSLDCPSSTDADDVNLAYSHSSPNLLNMDHGKRVSQQIASAALSRSRSSSFSQTISQSLSTSDDQKDSSSAFPLSQSFDFDGSLRENMSPGTGTGVRSIYGHESTLSASARRILSSASFDSDYSDGALGAENFNFDSGESDSHSRSFSASEDEEEEGVKEFDEFADFNEFDHHYDREKGRSASSAELNRIMSNSSLDDSSIDSPRSPDYPAGYPNNNKNASHELTCRQLVLTVLNTELLFAPPAATPSPGKQTSRKSKHSEENRNNASPHPADREKHLLSSAAKTSAHLAASFFHKSRNSIIGSLSHLGINHGGSSGTVGSDLSTENDSILQQNLTNAAASGPKSQKRSSKPPTPTAHQASMHSKQSKAVQERHEAEQLVKMRLSVFAAEDDGTAMDDLPEFTATTNILQSGAFLYFVCLYGQ